MSNKTICCICRSEAIRFASMYLAEQGLSVTAKPAPDVTHLLLPVPSFPTGSEYLAHLLADLPENILVCGGNLCSPQLSGYRTFDFLRDPYYLAMNAAITAECAMTILNQQLGTVDSRRVLVLGWGRIGKCLCRLLQMHRAQVCVAARRDSDLAMIQALGCESISIGSVDKYLTRYSAVINTVPAMILPEMTTSRDSVLLELASVPGMSGDNIISARGLPNKMAPEKSGQLIAETMIRYLNKEEAL